MILGSLCFTFCVSRRSLQLTLAWFVRVGWVGLLFSVGELNFDLFLTSSNKLTATVESNAATEKKRIVQDGKTSVLIRAEGHLALQPINRRSNVCGCMHIG